MPEETYNIYELLDEMHEKPAMYLGIESIILLRAYLDGYRDAMKSRGIRPVDTPPFHKTGGFCEWIEDTIGYGRSAVGWSTIILAETMQILSYETHWQCADKLATSEDDAVALGRFYELLDEYRTG